MVLPIAKTPKEEQSGILVTNGVEKAEAQAAVETTNLAREQEVATGTSGKLKAKLVGLGAALKAAAPMLLITALGILGSTFSDVEGEIGNASKLIVAAILLIGTTTVFVIKPVQLCPVPEYQRSQNQHNTGDHTGKITDIAAFLHAQTNRDDR